MKKYTTPFLWPALYSIRASYKYWSTYLYTELCVCVHSGCTLFAGNRVYLGLCLASLQTVAACKSHVPTLGLPMIRSDCCIFFVAVFLWCFSYGNLSLIEMLINNIGRNISATRPPRPHTATDYSLHQFNIY